MRKLRKYRFMLVFLTCVISAPSQAPSSAGKNDRVAREQKIVSDAYNKVAFLTELDVYSKTALNSGTGEQVDPAVVSKRLNNSVMSFTLSDFKTGDISEIADKKWGDIISLPPAGIPLVQVVLKKQSWQDSGRAPVEWTTAQVQEVNQPEVSQAVRNTVSSMSVRTILVLGGRFFTEPDVMYDRYASFQVISRVQGKTTGPYKALFFFGRNAEGHEFAAPQDPYSNATTLYRATSETFYPSGFLQTRFRELPVIADWLNTRKIDIQSCGTQEAVLCCTDNRCGVSNSNLQRDLSVPLGGNQPTPIRF